MNETLEIINNRSSLRKYADKPIEKGHLEALIESAMRAPTAGNMMAYSLIVVTDPKIKATLSHTCDGQPFIKTAPVIFVFAADYQKWFDYYRINGTEAFCEKTGRSFNVPSEANLLLAIEDAVAASENVVIAGESLGIGSCYIGDIMERYEVHKELFSLPEYTFPVAMLCLGYYPEGYEKNKRGRFPKEFVVFENTYKKLSEEEIKSMYSEWGSRFTVPNQFQADNYAQMHYAFKVNADFSREMARSVKEVLKIWNGGKA